MLHYYEYVFHVEMCVNQRIVSCQLRVSAKYQLRVSAKYQLRVSAKYQNMLSATISYDTPVTYRLRIRYVSTMYLLCIGYILTTYRLCIASISTIFQLCIRYIDLVSATYCLHIGNVRTDYVSTISATYPLCNLINHIWTNVQMLPLLAR